MLHMQSNVVCCSAHKYFKLLKRSYSPVQTRALRQCHSTTHVRPLPLNLALGHRVVVVVYRAVPSGEVRVLPQTALLHTLLNDLLKDQLVC